MTHTLQARATKTITLDTLYHRLGQNPHKVGVCIWACLLCPAGPPFASGTQGGGEVALHGAELTKSESPEPRASCARKAEHPTSFAICISRYVPFSMQSLPTVQLTHVTHSPSRCLKNNYFHHSHSHQCHHHQEHHQHHHHHHRHHHHHQQLITHRQSRSKNICQSTYF